MGNFILTDENALGNTAIFARDKTAFLCSQKVPSATLPRKEDYVLILKRQW